MPILVTPLLRCNGNPGVLRPLLFHVLVPRRGDAEFLQNHPGKEPITYVLK